ncbi:hypothetical protein NPM17_25495, partial [Escherichia coli]|nr:hypothetical protein [Escherichia coli]
MNHWTTVRRFASAIRRPPQGLSTTSVRPAEPADHAVFKTPWTGDPRVNTQNSNGQAKPYQVRQVLAV